jgi:hypothetical protein
MELPLRLSLIQMLSASERLWQPHPADWLKEHDNMADDKTKVGGQDRKRINLSEDYEVRDWCNSLGVNEEQLRMAVAAVGDEADAVRAHLGKN